MLLSFFDSYGRCMQFWRNDEFLNPNNFSHSNTILVFQMILFLILNMSIYDSVIFLPIANLLWLPLLRAGRCLQSE